MVVLIFLYALKFRERFFDKPELVAYQQFSPEKNLYSQVNYKARFGKLHYFSLVLPFWGEWKVTQSHNGKFTHQGDWRHAWDFEAMDEQGLSYSGDGNTREDYYAYNKPVVAPASGYVEEIVDDVEENEIGKVDLEHNWGNTIIIRHTDQLYSKLSHLKKGSFKVVAGDTVKKGQVVAACGNSGRSPVPHIHFQLQGTPYIGSRTLDYPISHFIRHKSGVFELRSYESPENNILVSNISKNASLEKAFHFIPGQEFRFNVIPENGKEYQACWEVKIDLANQAYVYCEQSKSKAWFRNDGDIHYFTHFEGDKSSLLFRFYMGAYKVTLGYYRNLLVKDQFPVNTFNNFVAGLLQDVVAPVWLFTRSDYSLSYLAMDDALMQTNIRLRSLVSVKLGKHEIRQMSFEMHIGLQGLESFIIRENGKETKVKRTSGQ
jgi:murein DD-endopeptidase MepM/ murein hydrolase activator NlpD